MSKKKSLKHSPGPWVKAIVAASGHDLAGRRDFDGSLYGSEHDRDDFGRRKLIIAGTAAEEDWSLMEAAPELLEVCERIQKWLGPSVDDETERLGELLDRVIAKARGTENE